MDLNILHRWDRRSDDREVYDLVFDEAIALIGREETTVGALLMRIINEWEKNSRAIPMPVISAAYDLAVELKAERELMDELRSTLEERAVS